MSNYQALLCMEKNWFEGGNLGPLSSLALRFLWPCHWINHELPGFGTFPERKVKLCHQATMSKDVERPPKHITWRYGENEVRQCRRFCCPGVSDVGPDRATFTLGFDGCWRRKVEMYYCNLSYLEISSLTALVCGLILCLNVVSSFVWMC